MDEHYCQCTTSIGTSFGYALEFNDDCCGQIARFKHPGFGPDGAEIWFCAEHYDEYLQFYLRRNERWA